MNVTEVIDNLYRSSAPKTFDEVLDLADIGIRRIVNLNTGTWEFSLGSLAVVGDVEGDGG